ncbi:MAG: FAD-dependent oxidoreductase, partial [Thermomicrobiales bacterium]
MADFDLAVIGGGIVGLSTAMQMTERFPGLSVAVLEKEPALARHQTGRNSGVIHAGVYYQPGSLKARFCREGVEATVGFCREHGIAFEQCGKLLVATEPDELPRMAALYER